MGAANQGRPQTLNRYSYVSNDPINSLILRITQISDEDAFVVVVMAVAVVTFPLTSAVSPAVSAILPVLLRLLDAIRPAW